MWRIVVSSMVVAAGAFSAGCSTAGSGGETSWHNDPYKFGESAVSASSAPSEGSAKVVFVRSKAPGPTEAVANIYIGDRYLTSLMPGAYVVHEACAGPNRISAIFDDASLKHEAKYKADKTVNLEAGKTYYFDVRNKDASGATDLALLDPAKVSLAEYSAQTHAISRVPKTCEAPAAAPAATPVVPIIPPPAGKLPSSPVCPASQRGADVSKASSSLATNDVIALRCAVEAWRADWASGNYDAYRSHYDDGAGSLARKKGWEPLRKKRLKNTNITIAISDLKLTEKGGLVTSDFMQDYRSTQYKDKGVKRLTWKRVGDEWKIVSEGFEHSGKKH